MDEISSMAIDRELKVLTMLGEILGKEPRKPVAEDDATEDWLSSSEKLASLESLASYFMVELVGGPRAQSSGEKQMGATVWWGAGAQAPGASEALKCKRLLRV